MSAGRSSFWVRPYDGHPSRPPAPTGPVGQASRSLLELLRSINNLLLPPLATLMLIEPLAGPEAYASVHGEWFMLRFCGLFGAEWLLGLALASSRRAYLWNGWLLADLVSSIPFNWLFQVGRFVRFARLTRILRLGRYRHVGRVARVARFTRLQIDLRRAGRAVGLVLALALSGALALRAVEPEVAGSLLDAVWWAVVTITAVGYGDIAPASVPGRQVGMALILASLAVFGYAAALASSALDREGREGKQREVLDAIAAAEERTAARIAALEAAVDELAGRGR